MTYEDLITARIAESGLSEKEIDEFGDQILEAFLTHDANKNGTVDKHEIEAMLKTASLPLAGYEVRNLLEEYDLDRNNELSVEEFTKMYVGKKKSDRAHIKGNTKQAANVIIKQGKNTGQHVVGTGEARAFGAFIQQELGKDAELEYLMPINGNNLYDQVQDGRIICSLVNAIEPNTIHEKTIEKTKLDQVFRRRSNLRLGINSAAAVGCQTVNITPMNIDNSQNTNEHIILGLLWQLLRKIAFKVLIDRENAKNLAALLRDGETLQDLMNLSPEEILLRWMNWHLDKDREAGKYNGPAITNFRGDIKDSQGYISLLNRIQPNELSPQLNYDAQSIGDSHARGQAVQDMATRLDCGEYITPEDIVGGNERVNTLFVANLFNKYPALDKVEIEEEIEVDETREEKMYRNWACSVEGVPYFNFLYQALRDGGILLKIEDKISPGIVNWKMVNSPDSFRKPGGLMKKIANCNLAVDTARDMKMVIVGIDGANISDGHKMFTLAIVWQLMRAYTLGVIKGAIGDKSEKEADAIIINWANAKLVAAGKDSSFRNFSDRTLADSKIICDLIDAIQPNVVNYDVLSDDLLENARYTIGCCRRVGARVYALPEDIVEVKKKMIMTIFACLMGTGLDTGVAADGDQDIATHRID